MDTGLFGQNVRPGQLTDAHKAMSRNIFAPDVRNVKIVGAISDVYKALAEKMFENNPVMHALIMSRIDTTSIYEFPVCGKCETVATWTDGKYDKGGKLVARRCGCLRCGAISDNPPTVKEWMRYEMKRRVPKDFFEVIDFGLDGIARSMMKTYLTNLLHAAQNPVDVSFEPGYNEEGVEVDRTQIE